MLLSWRPVIVAMSNFKLHFIVKPDSLYGTECLLTLYTTIYCLLGIS